VLPRALGIPAAALVVLVTAPGLVVKTVGTSSSGQQILVSPQAPVSAPPSATLKVGVTHSSLLLNVRARGNPEPKETATLVDTSGAHTATVKSLPSTSCAHSPVHDTGTGPTTWCLSVTSLDTGFEQSGTLQKGGTTLTLALTRKHALLVWPFLVLLAGLVVPFGIGAFKKFLQPWAGGLAVSNVIARNANQPREKISDLGEWADEQAKEGKPPGDILAIVQRVVGAAPKIRRTRKVLAQKLRATPLANNHPYVVAARDEVRRSSVRVADIVDDTGKAEPPRAQVFADHLAQLEADQASLVQLRGLLDRLDDGCSADARKALDIADAHFKSIDAPERVASLDDYILDAHGAISAATETAGCVKTEHAKTFHAEWQKVLENSSSGSTVRIESGEMRTLFRFPDRTAGAAIVRQLRSVTTPPLELTGRALWRDELVAMGLTGGAMLVTFAFAATTVVKAAYYGNATFSSGWDYFTLFSAALASGAAATVLTLVDYWHPKPTAGA
jgi:hypothetical protein